MARKTQHICSKLRLLLVDDEPAVRRGLHLLVSQYPELEVCGEAESESEALAKVAVLQPDLVVADLSLKGGDGFSLIRQLRRRCGNLKILVFSMHNQVSYAQAAFRAGAQGYVTKEEGAEQVIEAIQSLVAGKPYLAAALAAKMSIPRGH